MQLLSLCPSKYLLAPSQLCWLLCDWCVPRGFVLHIFLHSLCFCYLGGGHWADGPGEVFPTAQYLCLSLREHRLCLASGGL